MEKPVKVATAVSFNQEKDGFLLLKRSENRDVQPGKWDFPSGHIDEDEEPKNAALRELKEETGLLGKVLKSGEPFAVDTEDGFYEVHPFLVKVKGTVELSREHTDYKWVKSSELKDFETVEGLKKDLEKVGALE